MSPQDFKKYMNLIFDYGCCPEENHIAADILMCDILEELGYTEGISIYKKALSYEE
jgi:hypothetical protein